MRTPRVPPISPVIVVDWLKREVLRSVEAFYSLPFPYAVMAEHKVCHARGPEEGGRAGGQEGQDGQDETTRFRVLYSAVSPAEEMVHNDREYGLTKSQADRCRAAIERAVAAGPSKGMDPRLHAVGIDAMRRQLEELETQLREYKAGPGKPTDSRS
jgi:hypothetical protein